MIAYIDSSVLLRMILGEPDRLAQWESIETGVSSVLAEVECLRVLDRLNLQGTLGDTEYADARISVFDLMSRMELVEISRPVLSRAASRFPVPLGTLDAIHLATAVIWRDLKAFSLVMATHDRALYSASRALGMAAYGC